MKWKENLHNFFFAQNWKYYAKFNFLNKLTKIEVLSAELNNWRFIQLLHTKNYQKSMTKLQWQFGIFFKNLKSIKKN